MASPLGCYAPARRLLLKPGEAVVPAGHPGPLLLYHRRPVPPQVDGRTETPERYAGMREFGAAQAARNDTETGLWLLPQPVRRQPGSTIAVNGGFSEAIGLMRRSAAADPREEHEQDAQELMLRAEAVWDRIGDVEDALTDPARLWQTLRARWTESDAREPRMDFIVVNAQELGRVLDALEQRPRRILR